MLNYFLLGGYVTSTNDGDEHYISATKLINLYGVDRRDCLIAGNCIQIRAGLPEGLLVLTPRSDGNYTIPTPDVEWL